MVKLFRVAIAGAILTLAACGDSEEDQRIAALAAYDETALLTLFADGNFDEAIQSIEAKRQLGLAGETEDRLLLRIRIARRDGIGAEVLVDKLLAGGAAPGPLALARAKALFMQGKAEAARDALKIEGLPQADQLESLLLEGDIARELGEADTARTAYEKAVNTAPDDFRAYLSLGLLAYANNQLEDAGRFSAQAAERAPDDAMVVYLEGLAARYSRRYDLALAKLQRAVELNPTNQLAYLELAGLNIELDRRDAAEAALDAVYAQAPQNPMAHYLSALLFARAGKPAQAEAMLLRTGELTRDYLPAARALGLVSAELGKYGQAVRPLSRYLQVVPQDRVVRLTLVDCLIKRGEPKDARKVLAPLLAENPNDPAAQALAASAAAAGGDMAAAQAIYEKARADDGGAQSQADIRFQRDAARKAAVARFMSGDRAGALDSLKVLATNAPEDSDLQLLYGNFLVQVGDFTAAEAQAPKVGDPEVSAEAANFKGLLRYSQGRVAEAVPYYSKALALNPSYASALKNRGLAYVVLRQFKEALPDIEGAAKSMPNDGQLHALWGRTLFELGRPADALPHFRQAQVTLPKSPIVLADQSETLAALGFHGQAIEMAAAAKALIPADKDFAAYLDDKITAWQLAEEAAKQERADVEAARTKAVRRELEKAAETREAIKNNDTDPK